MTKMTEKELLAMTLEDCPLDISFDVALNRIIIGHDDLNKSIALDLDLDDIELIPESPAITFKNLGRFMAKHGKGPKCVFWPYGENGTSVDSRLGYIHSGAKPYYSPKYEVCFKHCKITDELWGKMGVNDE